MVLNAKEIIRKMLSQIFGILDFFFIWIGGAGAMVYILVSQQNAVSLILDAEVNISSNTKEKVTTYLKI